MKKILVTIGIVGILAMTAIAGSPKAYFSPKGGCEKVICKEIGNAKTSVVIAAYVYCNKTIVAEIMRAHDRGVKVDVIVDPSQVSSSNSFAVTSSKNGIGIWVDSKHALFHNKYIVIDHKRVLTGSFNYSFNAENRNAENLVIQTDNDLAAQFEKDWELHRSHSLKFDGVVSISRELPKKVGTDDGEDSEP